MLQPGASERRTGAPRPGTTERRFQGVSSQGYPLRFAKRIANTSNVDLAIEGTRPLCHILQEFSESDIGWLGYIKTERGHFANVEVTALSSDPHSIVSEFCDAIEGFREDAEATWAGAHRKTFDVGLDRAGSAGCSGYCQVLWMEGETASASSSSPVV